MGYYINPLDMTKEKWLEKYGRPMPDETPDFRNEYPVCLVDNGLFTAAAIAYCREEYEAFKYPDPRPKKWYMVPVKHLVQYMR